MKKITKQYDKIGKDYIEYQKDFFGKNPDVASEFIMKSIPSLEGKVVLDIGCGSGGDIIKYENSGAKEVYGIDSSNFMINEAKKKVKNPENLFVADAREIPFEKNFFDIVVSRYAIHYLKNIDKVYEEIHRVLKDNELAIIVVSHPLINFSLQKRKIYGNHEIIQNDLYDGKIIVKYPSHTMKDYFSETFFKLFQLKGFREEAEEPNRDSLPTFFGFVAIKK